MPSEQAGVAAAVVSSGRNVGIVLGIAAPRLACCGRLPDAATVDEFASALTPAYLVAAAVLAVATVVARSHAPSRPAGLGDGALVPRRREPCSSVNRCR